MKRGGLSRYVAAVVATTLLLSAASAGAEGLRAHHATYILSIGSNSGSSSITGADGVMVFDLKNVCDGWASDLKSKIVMGLEGGENRGIESSQVTWESKDGTAYRYVIKNGYGDGRTVQLRGEARNAGG